MAAAWYQKQKRMNDRLQETRAAIGDKSYSDVQNAAR